MKLGSWFFICISVSLGVITASVVACLAQPSPPPLANPVQIFQAGVQRTYGWTTCTPYGDGVHDDTACMQAAVSAGDVLVEPAKPGSYYYIAGPWIIVPPSRNIRCDTNGQPALGTVAFGNENPNANFFMFSFGYSAFGYYGGSIYGCQFRGPNYNAVGRPAPPAWVNQGFVQITGPGGGGQLIAENDFNGIGGLSGAVNFEGTEKDSPPLANAVVEYNTFEHCSSNAWELTAGVNNTITHNTVTDCSPAIEAYNLATVLAWNVVSYNTISFQYGVGACTGNNCSANFMTGGVACHPIGGGDCTSYAQIKDYSTNVVEFNTVTASPGMHVWLIEGNDQNGTLCGPYYTNTGLNIPAIYFSNTCNASNNCTIWCPPGSGWSNQ